MKGVELVELCAAERRPDVESRYLFVSLPCPLSQCVPDGVEPPVQIVRVEESDEDE